MKSTYNKIEFNGELISDITTRYLLNESRVNDDIESFYGTYIINDWASPEEVAHMLYGSCNYVWVILLVNNIIDPINDWLYTDDELNQYIDDMYGNNRYGVHHYEKDGIIYYEKTDPDMIPVTNEQYEIEKNENKRVIKVVFPDKITQFNSFFKNLNRNSI